MKRRPKRFRQVEEKSRTMRKEDALFVIWNALSHDAKAALAASPTKVMSLLMSPCN